MPEPASMVHSTPAPDNLVAGVAHVTLFTQANLKKHCGG